MYMVYFNDKSEWLEAMVYFMKAGATFEAHSTSKGYEIRLTGGF